MTILFPTHPCPNPHPEALTRHTTWLLVSPEDIEPTSPPRTKQDQRTIHITLCPTRSVHLPIPTERPRLPGTALTCTMPPSPIPTTHENWPLCAYHPLPPHSDHSRPLAATVLATFPSPFWSPSPPNKPMPPAPTSPLSDKHHHLYLGSPM